MELIDSNFPTGTPDLSDFVVLLTVQEPCPIASPCEIARNIEASQLMTAQASTLYCIFMSGNYLGNYVRM